MFKSSPLRRALRTLLALTTVAALAACSSTAAPAAGSSAASTVSIKDHWERTVQVPVNPARVVVLEWEGLITKSMRIFGVDDALVGVDSATKKMGYRGKLVPSIEKAPSVTMTLWRLSAAVAACSWTSRSAMSLLA